MSEGKFLTFPHWLLSMPKPEKKRLQSAVTSSMFRAGANPDNVSDEDVLGYVAKHQEIGYDYSAEHKQLVRGAMTIGVTAGHLRSQIKALAEVNKFVADLESRHGPGPIVFVSSALFWGCHDNNDPDWRDFTTLCAINSVIGFKKTPVLLRREMIIARQLGYKSPAVMRHELQQRSDQKPLTIKQLRDTLDSLESRELICRCQASRRCVYFSTSLTAEDLRSAVKAVVEKKAKVRLRRDIDRETFPRTQNGTTQGPLGGHLKRKQGKQAEKGPLKKEGPLEGHNGATGGATGGATTGATKISAFEEMPLQEVPFQEVSDVASPASVEKVEEAKTADWEADLDKWKRENGMA